MGTSQSSTGGARQPFIHYQDDNASFVSLCTNSALAMPEGDLCPICIGSLTQGAATVFDLPGCGHRYHTLCIASALQVAQACPVCRGDVPDAVCNRVAAKIFDEGGPPTLALDLLLDLQSRGRQSSPLEGEVLDDEVIEAIRRAAKAGDTSKIPAVAVFLGKGARGKRPYHSTAVRVAALEALRRLVPTFSTDWPGLDDVLKYLRETCLEDSDCDVRCAGLRMLREVCVGGQDEDVALVRSVMDDPRSNSDVRQEAAEALRVFAEKRDAGSGRAALQMMGDEDPGVRCVAVSTVKAIGTRGGAEAQDLLEGLATLATQHRLAEVRASACEVVGVAEKPGGAFGIAALAIAIKDPEEQVHLAALASLRRLWTRGDVEAVVMLAGVVADSTRSGAEQLRVEAVRALPRVAVRPDRSAASALLQALADSNVSVQTEAAQGLKQVCDRGDRDVTEGLMRYFSHPSSEVKRLAIECLGAVASRDDEAAKRFLQKVADSGDADLLMSAEGALRALR